jgi:hypothetical protein
MPKGNVEFKKRLKRAVDALAEEDGYLQPISVRLVRLCGGIGNIGGQV